MTTKGVLALENDDPETRVEPEVKPEDAENAELATMEVRDDQLDASGEETAAMGEVAQGEAAVTELLDQSEQGEEVAERLETVAEKLEPTVGEERNGIDEEAADALNVAVEGLLLLLGSPADKAKIFPAMEGFRDPATRKDNTRLAMEDIAKNAKAIWEKLVAFIAKVAEAAASFIKSAMAGTLKLQARAKMIKAAALKKKGATGGDLKQVKGSFLRRLQLGEEGKLPASGNELRAALDALHNDKLVSADYGKLVTVMNQAISKMANANGKDDDTDEIAAAIEQAFVDFGMGRSRINEHDLPIGMAGVHVEMSGEAHVFSVNWVMPKKMIDEAAEAPALTPEEIISLVDQVSRNLAKFSDYERQSGVVESVLKSAMATVKNKMSDSDGNKEAQRMMKAISFIKNAIVRLSTLLRNYELQTLSAALDYAAASLRAHGAKAESAAENKEPATA